MSNQNAFPKHLDKTVIGFFLGIFFISASVFAYRYTKYEPCKEVLISVTAKEFRQGSLITFKDHTENANSWIWDFGDNTSVTTSKLTLHDYKKPGEYNVRLLVNGICEKNELVTIKEKLFILDSTKLAKFELPETIKVGDVLKVIDETNNASTWEWNFGETHEANSEEKNAEYTYNKPGLKTVSLVVNGDIKHSTKKQINVLPVKKQKAAIVQIKAPKSKLPKNYNIPERLEPEVNNSDNLPAPLINKGQFTNILYQIANEKKRVTAFSKYFCNNLDRVIIANGKEIKFRVFCEKIAGRNRKLKIRDVNLEKDSRGCITMVTIKYKKGLFEGN